MENSEKTRLNRKFFATAFTLSGATIGAGILGLPYVFSKAGFWIGSFWLLVIGLIMLFTNLAVGEVSLRTRKIHQLPGYAEKYLGKTGKILMLFAVMFGVYSALLAYLVGEGQSLSRLFFGSFDYSVYFAIGFWLCMFFLFREGLRQLKRVELYGVFLIIAIILGMFVWFYPGIDETNLQNFDAKNFFLPFGLVLFALLGFTSISEMRLEIRGSEKSLKKAIILGTLVPIILYFIFSLVFVGVLGKNVEEVATISLGNLTTLLGIATMLTSYFALSFVLKDIFVYDVKKSRLVFPLVILAPLLMYLLLVFMNLADFIDILTIGGIVSGGLTALLILLMHLKAKKKGDRKPEFSVYMRWPLLILIGMIFVLGVFFELF
jgi:tyrosine-specific transport protein